MTLNRRSGSFALALVLFACTAPDSDEAGRASQAVSACRTVPLIASVTSKPKRHTDASVDLAPPLVFEVPAEIDVTEGNAGNQHAVLRITSPGLETKCRYRSPGFPHPHTPAELAAASRYLFEHCTVDDDAVTPPHAGDAVTATHVELTIDGDNKVPITTAEIDLVEIGRRTRTCTAIS
jgi:hypothetical protein